MDSKQNSEVDQNSFKMILIGDSMVGKTSIIHRYIDKSFLGNHGTTPTLSWDFKVKNVNISQRKGLFNDDNNSTEQTIKLFVWDTAGQERFRHITRMYYKNIQAVLVVFDLTDEDSFKGLNFWLNDLRTHAPEKVIMILIGNKLDLTAESKSSSVIQCERKVSYDEAQEYALQNQMYYYECSAKTGENIDEVFQKASQEIYNNKQLWVNMNLQGSINKSLVDSAVMKTVSLSNKSVTKTKQKCCS